VVRLAQFAARKPSQLSGGQQQRVALARALVNYPSALLLDEPLAALDLKLREAMQIELKRIQREVGISFIFVTHDQGEALTMSDRIVVMSEGVVEQIATPEEIYRRPASLFVAGFIGSSNLLPGNVTEVRGGEVVVKLAVGATVTVVDDAPSVRVNERVSVMLRPERLVPVAQASTGVAGLDCTLTDLVYQGATARVIVRLADDTEMAALTDADRLEGWMRPGASLRLEWPRDCPYVLSGWPDRAGATTTDVDSVEAEL